MQFRNCWIALFLLFLALSKVAAQSAYPEILYVSPDQSVWTTKLNARGEPDNPLFQIAERIFREVGIPWQVKSYPAPRMFRYLQEGSANFSMLVRNPGLQDCCLYSRKPVAVAEIRAYSLPGKPRLRGREDLAGKNVIAVHGYSYGDLLNQLTQPAAKVSLQIAQSHRAAFAMLAGERGDYVLDYSGPASEILAESPLPGVQSDLISRQEVFMVLSRSYPEAERVMEKLEIAAEKSELNRQQRRK